jgi:hypothetical protein
VADLDIVYTWVDDTWPGYAETLRAHAEDGHDRNPNRTRDNLDLLKYSLRSLARHCPWAGRIHLVSAAPQIPRWLNRNAEGLRVIHHDAIIPAEYLPTFSSFGIVSCLHRIEGLSERFLYVEDDMLFGPGAGPGDFVTRDGRLRLFPRLGYTCAPENRARADISPWNAALARCNFLLDTEFTPMRRRGVNHVPLLIEKHWWQEMTERWAEDVARTRGSRFRKAGTVAPEYLYPWFLYHTGRAVLEPLARTWREHGYAALENTPFITALALLRARLLPPKTLALNDGFGPRPRPAVVKAARRFLESSYPVKSRFEL